MEPEYHLKVYDIVKTQTPSGRHSQDGEPAGDTVRALIEEHWDTHEKIVVSFDGIVKMSRVFVDEAFARILEKRSLAEFNRKLFFPDATPRITKDLNEAAKLRLKIMEAKREREQGI